MAMGTTNQLSTTLLYLLVAVLAGSCARGAHGFVTVNLAPNAPLLNVSIENDLPNSINFTISKPKVQGSAQSVVVMPGKTESLGVELTAGVTSPTFSVEVYGDFPQIPPSYTNAIYSSEGTTLGRILSTLTAAYIKVVRACKPSDEKPAGLFLELYAAVPLAGGGFGAGGPVKTTVCAAKEG